MFCGQPLKRRDGKRLMMMKPVPGSDGREWIPGFLWVDVDTPCEYTNRLLGEDRGEKEAEG